MRTFAVSNATIRRFGVGSLGIVALVVTFWPAVVQAGPAPAPTATPTPTPTVMPTPGADCLCQVRNINPNQIVLQNVRAGGKGATGTKKMAMIVYAVNGPGSTCDPGEISYPTRVNLKMEDDSGNILVDSAKVVVCRQGVTTIMTRNVFFQGPLNCESGAVPDPISKVSTGTITSTGSAPGATDYVESTRIKCFE
jgi:hypothetical protein